MGKKERIGVVGAYSLNNLPLFILKDISTGLTTILDNGNVKPGIAKNWEIKDGGKTYIFNLNTNLYFNDGKNIDSYSIQYNFSDAKIERPEKYKIIFKLKESFSPFLSTVSRPVFKKGFVGAGEYKITDVKLNGDFVKSITLASVKDQSANASSKTYIFYPSTDALKVAYLLGEVSKAQGLSDISYKDKSFSNFQNTNVDRKVNYKQLVSLFYNTRDPVLSDKKIRDALSYAIPDTLSFGQRNSEPYPPSSWAYNEQYARTEDLEHSRLLLSAASSGSKSAALNLKIKTLTRYKSVASEISKNWKKININIETEIVDNIPENYQIFLGDFYVPSDPDQYMLWHSVQENNITNYENKRIDKLLEDGRKETNTTERKKIYADFQKYLIDDSPATFLFFPYEYEITRK